MTRHKIHKRDTMWRIITIRHKRPGDGYWYIKHDDDDSDHYVIAAVWGGIVYYPSGDKHKVENVMAANFMWQRVPEPTWEPGSVNNTRNMIDSDIKGKRK